MAAVSLLTEARTHSKKLTMVLSYGVVWSLALVTSVNSFLSSPALTSCRRQLASTTSSCLFSSKEDNLDDMRRLLEASWNVDTMGTVPTNPEDAADAAAGCIQSAVDNGGSMFFVDLLLPSYDISQGTNMYDEVLAVEFCIALAKSMEEKSCVLVRDDKTKNAVNRVLEARDRNRLDDYDEDKVEDEEEEDDDEDNIDTEFYDDFADFGGAIGNTDSGATETPSLSKEDDSGSTSTGDVDAFREQLMAKWDEPTIEGSYAQTKGPAEKPEEEGAAPPEPKSTSSFKDATNKPAYPTTDRFYRLASLFGPSKISAGPDMMDQVIKAVDENGKPTDDEDTIIILSAVEQDEMIAVRSLVAKYKGSKKIVLVNCKLDPLPRELIRANTVYSILPLVARPVVSERNIFGKDKAVPAESEPPPPKVVVMRRYPKDWEVYVDADGNGFELADVAKASQVRGKKGPPMDWVAGCVKRHMESKFGGGR